MTTGILPRHVLLVALMALALHCPHVFAATNVAVFNFQMTSETTAWRFNAGQERRRAPHGHGTHAAH